MEKINVTLLTDEERQALVCMFFARLHKNDERYSKRIPYFTILEKRYNRKVNTYKNDIDAFDPYFDSNGRKGWDDKPIEKRNKVLKEVLDKYADTDDAVLEEAVKEIIDICEEENRTMSFVAARVQQPEQAHALLDPNNVTFTIDGIYTLQSSMTKNRIVFIALGGDAGQASVDWARGFYAIGHIIKEPYDIGYKPRTGSPYYKVDLHIDWRCEEAISKDLLMSYPDTYDSPYMGLEIHRDPTQAVCQLEDTKAVAIIRAVVDMYKDTFEIFKNIFPNDFMERVAGMAKRIIEVSVDHNQSLASAIQEKIDELETKDYDEEVPPEEIVTGARNLILFGAPGTGKSHLLNEKQVNLLGEESKCWERVTFHPDYTYANFVGCYKPVPAKDREGNDTITYKYVPGPFMRMLVKALRNPRQAYLLLIEEINRANVAAVFGDVFQLLDRNKIGESEYSIQTSEDMREYLKEELNGAVKEKIVLPPNLHLWATMNSADQGVYPMDTAFKRRWDFEYIDIDNGESKIDQYNFTVKDTSINWNALRKAINKQLTEIGINEDKLMGAFFIAKYIIDEDNDEKFVDTFCNKVIMYLFEDAARQKTNRIFNLTNGKARYSMLCNDFKKKGLSIFVDAIKSEYERLTKQEDAQG